MYIVTISNLAPFGLLRDVVRRRRRCVTPLDPKTIARVLVVSFCSRTLSFLDWMSRARATHALTLYGFIYVYVTQTMIEVDDVVIQ